MDKYVLRSPLVKYSALHPGKLLLRACQDDFPRRAFEIRFVIMPLNLPPNLPSTYSCPWFLLFSTLLILHCLFTIITTTSPPSALRVRASFILISRSSSPYGHSSCLCCHLLHRFLHSASSFSAQPLLASFSTMNRLPSRNHVSLLDI